MMKQADSFVRRTVLLAIPMLALTGCETFGPTTHRQTSSVVQYLYPKTKVPTEQPGLSTLSLPLKVGVAFVPGEGSERRDAEINREKAAFSEEQKMELMKKVAADFKQYPFVHSIQLIPSAYLSSSGGFDNLDQIRSMFGIDVIALLSYDQMQFRDTGLLSLTYVTVVGAYVIQGEKNETQTMVDAAVFDIASRKLLFRAPGISKIKGAAMPINLSEEMRHDSEDGLKQAAGDLVKNLQVQLVTFKDEIKKSPREYAVQTKPGYSSAAVGAVGRMEICFLIALGLGGLLAPTRGVGRTNNRPAS